MRIEMDEEFKRWSARRKSAMVLNVIQRKTAGSEWPGKFDLPPSEMEFWVDQSKARMENTLKPKPENIRWQCETPL